MFRTYLFATGVTFASLIAGCTSIPLPTEASELATTFGPPVVAAVGRHHAVVHDPENGTFAWGNNEYGQLLDGSVSNQTGPTLMNPPATMNVDGAFAVGDFHTLTLDTTGTLWAWGFNRFGELGNGQVGSGYAKSEPDDPVRVEPPLGVNGWTKVRAGWYHSVALTASGRLYAWGENQYGELGIGPLQSSDGVDSITEPTEVVHPDGVNAFKDLAASDSHSVALSLAGELFAFGLNEDGQLGDSTTQNKTVPTLVTKPVGVTEFTGIAVGASHSLALDLNGRVYAWGNNDYGQNGMTARTPAKVTEPSEVSLPQEAIPVQAIAAGTSHSLALGNDGHLYAWGRNISGQLGIGSEDANVSTPTLVTPPDNEDGWISVHAGGDTTVAVSQSGRLYQWGERYGEPNFGVDSDSDPTPRPIQIDSERP